MNLNEINVPDGADEAMLWAAGREFVLRYDGYRESLIRERGLAEATVAFVCFNPEQEWIHSMRAELLER